MAEAVTAGDDLYTLLTGRGLVRQCTEPEQIRERLSRREPVYCGFDPTADSLHVGHLVPLMGLAWAQRLGHRPLVLVGGATGLVGDPSFKDSSRPMLDAAAIANNAVAIGRQMQRFLAFGEGASDALLLNNLDWIEPLKWLDVLRDLGSRVSVNRMMSMESVQQRMHGEDGRGISYLEFSYMLLQGYDFVHLHRHQGCTLQLAGQDQWGNIVMGIELARKLDRTSLAGLTLPLIVKADGSKFGKSESGAVWLDAERTTPWDFYQFWRNTADADVATFLAYFTFLPMAEVQSLASGTGPAINAAKERLAWEVTARVHGTAAADRAQEGARAAFAGGSASSEVPSAALPAGGAAVLELVKAAGFAKSNGEVRRLIQGGGVRVNGRKVDDAGEVIRADAAENGAVEVRVGKKKLFRFTV